MLLDLHHTIKESRWLRCGAWLVLSTGLVLSTWIWWQSAQSWQAQADEAFARQVGSVISRLEDQQDHYLDVLTSFKAMFRVSDQVDRTAFHQHYTDLDAQREYPALLAVQYAPWIPHSDKAALEARVRADTSLPPNGYPNYAIAPAGERDHYLPVVYNEPMAGNEAAFGHDQAYEAHRQEVMLLARDSGQAQASSPVRLVQGASATTPAPATGLLIRLPVYKLHARTDTVPERREAFAGLISGVFRTADLLQAAGSHLEWQQRHWQVRDITRPLQPQEVFDSRQQSDHAWASPANALAEDRIMRTHAVAGRLWELRITRPHQVAWLQPYPLALLFGGTVSTLALTLLLRSGAIRYRKAADLAMKLSEQARASESQLRSLVDNTAEGIMTVSPAGVIQSANTALCKIFGRARQDIVGSHLARLIPAAGRHTQSGIEFFLMSQRVGMDGLGHRTEGLRANGETFPLDLAVSSVDQNGLRVFIAILRDLSEQQSAERSILEARRQLNEVDDMRQAIVHTAPYAILVLNTHGVVQTINPAGEALLGYPAHALIGRRTMAQFFDPEQVASRAHLLSRRLNQPVASFDVIDHLAAESPGLPSEWNLLKADGDHLIAEVLVTLLSNEAGTTTGYLVMAHDVSSRRHAEDQLQHLAMHDALTALPNRNRLQEQLRTCLQTAEREGWNMAMMFLDLDRFKKINDTLGHHIGDSVLIEVARRLRSEMRTSDIVARLGGDEFVILLPRIAELDDGLRVAQKVLNLFVEPLRVGPHELRVTPSMGLALYPEHGVDAITLMRHADLAMYQAKNTGRNRIQIYNDQIESPPPDVLVLENDLYKALERNELRLHFQPQFDCASGAITGAEALLRWEHDGKLVPPGDFIPLAEESGLIVPMGEWVLRRACEMAHLWRTRTGWPLRIAVNLSAVQLDRPDIVDVVAQALQDTGLQPTALELEITESVVVRESLRAADVLNQLRRLGASIAIDDFGVGYSSFAYLRELPVDRFKLDRSFLSSVPQSEGDSRLTAALIAMAHRLDVGIVAEGVETAEQAAFLKDHGCDECQGYFMGRPMNETAFEALITEHSRTHKDLISTLSGAQAEIV